MANNRTQQRFDKSIREAVAVRQDFHKPRRARASAEVEPIPAANRRGWKLRIDPATGETVWGPK